MTETLPAGFTYVSSSLPNDQVSASGQTVTFTIISGTSFTYTVTAPATANTYTFSGTFRDADRVETNVGGASSLRVGAAPPPSVSTPVPVVPTPVPSPLENVRPTFDDGTMQERSVAEGAEEGANVGEPVTATDQNGDALTYFFREGFDEALFEIDGSTGQITVGEGTELDFESKSSYTVRIRAADPLGAADETTVTINVTDVDEQPTAAPTATSAPEPEEEPGFPVVIILPIIVAIVVVAVVLFVVRRR